MGILLSLIILAMITVIIMVNMKNSVVIRKKPETRNEKIKRIIAQKSIKPIPTKEFIKPIQIKTEIKKINEELISWNKAFLKSLEWKRYEDVCMEHLRIKNCDANVTCTGADGGIDIQVCDKNGIILAIGQCKAWSKLIGVNLIRELYGVMAAEQIKHGIFLTTSIFSQDAIEFAKNKTLLLVDEDEFVNLINGLDDITRKRIDHVATEGDYSTPTCFNCNVKMVKRVTKKGTNVGHEFWGCINYPKCKKTMNVKL
jgi:restriction system protein